MLVWDVVITVVKLLIITALWAVHGSVLSALLLYAVVVAMPLLLMRILSGYSIVSPNAILLSFVGLDLLLTDGPPVKGVR